MSDASAASIEQALRVTDAFMSTFNAQDWSGHFDTYNFPHIRVAGTEVKVWNDRAELLAGHAAYGAGRLERGWSRSAWDARRVIHSAADKVHLAVEFTRYDRDDNKLATYQAIYVVTCVGGHWGVQLRSSFAP
jgi:hypothetical protein